ncbi:ABC transporter permease subunit [Camelliibacillus cellulosilyticus]|uniref:ABC transporter permease subunit n=1 Tax=Camelliibacillus cellulosilyticus TaxID=2174486 RepID=A0ABV9GRL6_9BACL
MWRFLFQILLTILIAFVLGSLPYLAFNMDGLMTVQRMIDSGELDNAMFLGFDFEWNWGRFIHHMLTSVVNIFHLSSMTYYDHNLIKPLFPEYFLRYLYSMKILVASLGSAFCLSVVITIMIIMMPVPVKRLIKTALQAVQSIPDLFYLIFLQLASIAIYETFHVLFFEVAEYDREIYLLPIIVLTFFPTLQMIQYLIANFEQEISEPYVTLAQAKGLHRWRILLIHVLRNAIATFLAHLKTIFWFALSNLIMVEVLLNMKGFISFLFEYGPLTPEMYTYGLIMLVVPFMMFFFVLQRLVGRINRTELGEVI